LPFTSKRFTTIEKAACLQTAWTHLCGKKSRSYPHNQSVSISREKHLAKDKQFSWLQVIAEPDSLPKPFVKKVQWQDKTSGGSLLQWRDRTGFPPVSLSMLSQLIPVFSKVIIAVFAV
jgi:hypothetical protein